MKYTLRRQYLNSGGYTSNGCYFGIGSPLYWYCSDDCKYEGYLRAFNRHHAKNVVRTRHPETNPKFYN